MSETWKYFSQQTKAYSKSSRYLNLPWSETACAVAVNKEGWMMNNFTDLFEKTNNILADLGQANDDIVGVDVAERGMVTALTPYLV